MDMIRQKTQETEEERQARAAGDFLRIERYLPSRRATARVTAILRFASSFLGQNDTLAQPAHPRQNTVWLLDNTAYRPVHPYPHKIQPWQVDVIACVFMAHGRQDISKFVGLVADAIGLDGEVGTDEETRKRIAQRLQPFMREIAPARVMTLEVPLPCGNIHKHRLGPTDSNGISSQTVLIGAHDMEDGTIVKPYLEGWDRSVSMNTVFASPEGWLVISDVDDTIKYTQTPDAIGILRTTFAEEPKPIAGMPELYAHIQRQLTPTWFYVSASPYNLYPFLQRFLHSSYSPGTLILRDNSWMGLSGLLKSFTQDTQAYKVEQMDKIHRWFPQRKILCVGDSTQSDPEAYAEIYKKYKGWIYAIFIRKVIDVAHMEEKNSAERFEKAFEGVPRDIWKVFESPEGLYGLVDDLTK
ncbi:hypothetical protein VTN00DRAFT_1519 [Thermoascus crustaceus]|uniref:uncharacterized protein n=1 Tax=Thermoascus crustaceus TaxID=5088 RepID=UPI003743EEC3